MKQTALLFLVFCVIAQTAFGKQWIVFYADFGQVDHPLQNDPSKGGHAFVSFVREDPIKKQTLVDCWGFNPKNENEIGLISYVEGDIKNDIARQRELGFMIEVTEAELNACTKTKDQWVNSKYSVTMRNCVDFVRDIVTTLNENRAVGKPRLKQPIGLYVFPSEYVQTLKGLNSGLEYKYPVGTTTTNQSSQDNKLSDGARLLFSKEVATYYTSLQLTPSEKEEIYSQLNLQVSPNKKQLHDKKDNTFEYELSCTVRIIDLNNDGKLEVFVSLYNLSWTGQGGQETAFGKSGSGKFSEIFSEQGVAELLPTTTNGYPDLIVGGPGMTAPTQRWNGTKYQFYKEVSFGAKSAPKMLSFEDFYKKQKAK